MNATLALTSGTVRAIGAVSPRAASALALRLFMRIGPRMPLRADDEPTMDAATRTAVTVPGRAGDGTEVVVYSWGRSDRIVVLAHGWGGRASQFATLVRELLAEGYRVIAFDAPGHGASAGGQTYLIDWIDILFALQARYGRFHTVIGHSLGGLASLLAVADGVRTDRLVTVAAPTSADVLLAQFRGILGFAERTAAALHARFARTFFPGESDPFPRLSAIDRPVHRRTRLLVVHDDRDRSIPVTEALRLVAANDDAASLITTGSGHNRVLAADEFLDAVIEVAGTDSAQNSIPAVSDAGRGGSRRPLAARPREVVTT